VNQLCYGTMNWGGVGNFAFEFSTFGEYNDQAMSRKEIFSEVFTYVCSVVVDISR